MTLRHCVLMKIHDHVQPRDVQALTEALKALPDQIPEIRSYDVGIDMELRDGNADVGVVAQFDDEDAWRAYLEHPAHVAVVEEHIEPLVAERTSIQFEV